MSGILDLLHSDQGNTIINGISRETSTEQNKTKDVLALAMPLLMAAMRRNVQSQDGAQSLLQALNDKHDGSILENLGGFFGGGVNEEQKTDGNKILGHILGAKRPAVENTLSRKSGLDMRTVTEILRVAAPLVLGILAKEKKQKDVHSPGGLESLLGGLLGGSSSGNSQGSLESILDADGDGSIMDDIAGMVFGKGNKQ